MTSDRRITVGITGASGALYARRLLDCLLRAEVETHLVVSTWGRKLLHDELGVVQLDSMSLIGRNEQRLRLHSNKALDSPLASGSFLNEGMVICPCSSHTLGQVSSGMGDSLLTRAAAVTLKERRTLILVPREMPTSPIDLENMIRLSRAGATICPANPGFYLKPQTIDDLVDFVVGKLLDLLHVPHALQNRWEPHDATAAPATCEPCS